jgi:hypothetical protein
MNNHKHFPSIVNIFPKERLLRALILRAAQAVPWGKLSLLQELQRVSIVMEVPSLELLALSRAAAVKQDSRKLLQVRWCVYDYCFVFFICSLPPSKRVRK